jgi:hypothetical protein
LSEFPAPLPDGLIGLKDSPDEEQLFHVLPIAEAEAVVQPHAMADDLGGKTMVFVALGVAGGIMPSYLLWLPIRWMTSPASQG